MALSDDSTILAVRDANNNGAGNNARHDLVYVLYEDDAEWA